MEVPLKCRITNSLFNVVFRSAAAFEIKRIFTVNAKYIFGDISDGLLHFSQIGAQWFLLCAFVTCFLVFDVVTRDRVNSNSNSVVDFELLLYTDIFGRL